MNSIRNIIFDLGGVLLPVDYHAVIRAFGQLGVADAGSFYSQQAQQPLFDMFERGEISGGEFLFELKKLIPEASEAELIDAWNAILGSFPQERFSLLKKVGENYRLFLLSNTNAIHISKFLEDLKVNNGVSDFPAYFEEVYYSFETGFRKPEKEIFELLMLENNLNYSETIFIEDTFSNVEGARAAGLPTLYLKVHEAEQIEDYFTAGGLLEMGRVSKALMA